MLPVTSHGCPFLHMPRLLPSPILAVSGYQRPVSTSGPRLGDTRPSGTLREEGGLPLSCPSPPQALPPHGALLCVRGLPAPCPSVAEGLGKPPVFKSYSCLLPLSGGAGPARALLRLPAGPALRIVELTARRIGMARTVLPQLQAVPGVPGHVGVPQGVSASLGQTPILWLADTPQPVGRASWHARSLPGHTE